MRRATGWTAAAAAVMLSAPAAQGARFEAGQPFPAVELPSLPDGRAASIAHFRGKKLILHIFASW